LRQRAGIVTPTPIKNGLLELQDGYVLLFEALPELPAGARTRDDWRSIGHTLATLHQVRAERVSGSTTATPSSARCDRTTAP